MILTVIIAIPNTSDDVTIPTAIPTPSPVMQNSTTYDMLYWCKCMALRGEHEWEIVCFALRKCTEMFLSPLCTFRNNTCILWWAYSYQFEYCSLCTYWHRMHKCSKGRLCLQSLSSGVSHGMSIPFPLCLLFQPLRKIQVTWFRPCRRTYVVWQTDIQTDTRAIDIINVWAQSCLLQQPSDVYVLVYKQV